MKIKDMEISTLSNSNNYEPYAIVDKHKDDSEKENFFNHKKKKIILLWSILFGVIICIAIKFLLNVSLIEFFVTLSSVQKIPYFLTTILFGFITFFCCEIFIRVRVIKDKLGSTVKHVTKFEWISFTVISFIIQSVTPFAIGSEPYSIWWLNKKGIPLKTASAVVAANSVCWFVGQFFITWPSFIYLTYMNADNIIAGSVSSTYWFVLAGLLVDIGVSIFIFFISYSKKAHFWISKLGNKIKQYFSLQYLTEDELREKYLFDNEFQKLYIRTLFDRSTFRVIFWYLLNNIWVYGLFVLIHRLFNYSDWNFNATVNSYNLINVSTTATNFFPLPSAEGSLQVIINELLKGIPVTSSGTSSTDGQTILLWRFFCKYLGLILGFTYIFLFGMNSKKSKIRNIFKKKDSYDLIVSTI